MMPRTAWTNAAPGFNYFLDPAKVYFVALHYPADSGLVPPRDASALSETETAARIRAYRYYHIRPKPYGRGWPDIGYCFVVDQQGRVWDAAGYRVAAHSATDNFPRANHYGVGILLLIGNNETPTAKMVYAVNEFIAHLKTKYPKITTLWGHRDVPGATTQCPGDRAESMIKHGTFNLTATQQPQEDDELKDDERKWLFEVHQSMHQIQNPALGRLDTRTWTTVNELGKLKGQLDGLIQAVGQLTGGSGGTIDLAAVQEAARKGALEAVTSAIAKLQVSVELG